MSVLLARFAWPIAGVVLALAAVGAQEVRIARLQKDLAQESQARADDRAVMDRVALAAEQDARAEEQRRTDALRKAIYEAEQQTVLARKSAADANAVALGLRKRAATIASTCRRVPQGPAPADDGAADRLAGVFGECVAELATLADAADRAVIRGNACAAAYASLTVGEVK